MRLILIGVATPTIHAMHAICGRFPSSLTRKWPTEWPILFTVRLPKNMAMIELSTPTKCTGNASSTLGILTVVPDYSIFPPARFPTFVEDAGRAVRFARKSAAQWGGDPSRLVLMGHSAGAYIAAMLSFDPQWLGQVGLNSQTDLAGFIGLAGPYDFLPIQSRTLRTIFGGANRTETQPISFVTGKEAPALLITARRDRLVSPGNSRKMAAQIYAHGGVAEERTYGGVGHLTLIGAFAPGLRVLAPVLRDVTQFVWRVTSRPANLVRARNASPPRPLERRGQIR